MRQEPQFAPPALPHERGSAAVVQPSGNQHIWVAAALFATAAVYARCARFDFVLDDRIWVNNRYIGDWSFAWNSIVHDSWWFHDPAHLPQSPYYRPLQGILATVLYHLSGTNP
ncbi:MAG TPA: hypothetical protein VMT58_01860, partial [Candidatus Binataceae bacterium]|nr:hypothetical protein [Candidatus Binataceae bacterium]